MFQSDPRLVIDLPLQMRERIKSSQNLFLRLLLPKLNLDSFRIDSRRTSSRSIGGAGMIGGKVVVGI